MAASMTRMSRTVDQGVSLKLLALPPKLLLPSWMQQTEEPFDDPVAREFWTSTFGDKKTVTWHEFAAGLFAFLGIGPPRETDRRYRCWLALLINLGMTAPPAEAQVSFAFFNRVLQWFGPLNTNGETLDRVCNLLEQAWFHGALSTKEAEAKLRGAKSGTYLIRFSTTEPGSYAITVLVGTQIKHLRILHRPGTGYIIGKAECRSVEEVVSRFARELQLATPCPGSVFAHLREAPKVSRYEDFYDTV